MAGAYAADALAAARAVAISEWHIHSPTRYEAYLLCRGQPHLAHNKD